MTAAAWATIIASIVGAIISAFGKVVLDRETAGETRSDTIKLGQNQVTTAIAQEQADATKRAAQAQANAPAVGSMLDDLDRGVF